MSRKLRKVAADPGLLRYRVLGRVGVFPVRPIRNSLLTELPVYCISLQRSTQRRELIQRQVRAAGWRALRFVDAVDAAELRLDELISSGAYDPVAARRHHGVDLSLAEIACSLSHGRAYEQIVSAGHEQALVVEDDVLLETRRLRRLDLAAVPPDWEVLFLSSFLHEKPPRGHLVDGVYGTHSWHGSAAAYLVTADAARKLAQVHRPVEHAADGLLGRNLEALGDEDHPFRQKGARTSLRSYLVWPDPMVNGSDVHFYATTLRPAGPRRR